MAKKPEDILLELDDTLLKAIDNFNGDIPKMQEEMLDRVIELTTDLDRKNGNLVVSVNNLKIIRKIRKELANSIVNDDYLKRVDEFANQFAEVQRINDLYFASVSTQFAKRELYTEIRKLAVEQTLEGLGKQGLSSNVIVPLADILNKNITSGGSYKEFIGEVRGYLTNTDESKGALDRYAKVYTIDAINQFSAQYNQTITEDLGFVWYYYAGDKMKTSRDFCIKMMEARNGGCMKFFHKSQIPELLKGHICSGNVPIYKKINLPYGFKEGTNEVNFLTYRGGWGCQHRITSVPSSVVPKKLRDLFGS